MIHYTAHYGNPISGALSQHALTSPNTTISETEGVTFGRLISDIFGTTSRLLHPTLGVGGGVISPATIVAIITTAPLIWQVVGILAIWGAGGVYLPDGGSPAKVSSPDIILRTSPSNHIESIGTYSVEDGGDGDWNQVPWALGSGSRIVEIDQSLPPTSTDSYSVVDISTVCEWMRDLTQVDPDRPALMLSSEEGMRTVTFKQVSGAMLGDTNEDLLQIPALRYLRDLLQK